MTILYNARIWDGQRLLEGCDAIEIEAGHIARIGVASEFDGDDRRDISGAFLMPGLIDAHIHLCLNPDVTDPEAQDKVPRDELLVQMEARATAMLAAGITTARDLGGGQWLEFEVRDKINRGELFGTRLICSGQPITSPQGHCHFWGGEAASLDEAMTVLERQLSHGADLIKVMATGGNLTKGSQPKDAQFDEATLAAIVAEAADHGFHVAAHCHGTSGIHNAAHSGVTTIEHCSWVGDSGWARDFDADVAAAIVEKGAWVSPTINLGWKRRIGSGDYEALVRSNYDRMRDAGVRFIASTDAGIPKVYHHDLAKALPVFGHFAGLTNEAVMRAATADCAEAIGLGNLAGRLEAGLSADFLVLDGDPREDLAVLENPVDVVARGQSSSGIAAPAAG